MPKPAVELLRSESGVDAAWAVFDPDWYLRAHPEAAIACAGDPARALQYYLEVGARRGDDPNILFDEAYYLRRYPDIAVLVRLGEYQSGFDHFCRHGYRALAPHWLFDDVLYADLYDDMSIENLDRHKFYGRYDHWLRSGQFEYRTAHYLFDCRFYRDRAIKDGVLQEDIDRVGPYVHYLMRLGGGGPELPPSIYFEPDWYLKTHGSAREAIRLGQARNALHHYIAMGAAARYDPVPEFSEYFYYATYDDIQAAIKVGDFSSAYQHFLRHGAFELRRPRADIDLLYYRDVNPRVVHDLNSGSVRDAFAHLRLIGLTEGLEYCRPEQAPEISEGTAKSLFLLAARNALPLFARRVLDFTAEGPPQVAVIMVLFNKFELTMQALASLRDNFAGPIELILVDNNSSDETARVEHFVRGAKILHNSDNAGFVIACNQALELVTAPSVLFLNNDLTLGHGAIAAALARLGSDEKIGSVGGRIVRTHGRLQEAGSIIWQDGTTSGYCRDQPALIPEANFVRDVDYCSGAFLLCRTQLIRNLGGFDQGYAPAYYEEVDLSVRVIEAGYRNVYDPAITVTHLEFGSATQREASMELMRRNRRLFREKHAAFLADQKCCDPDKIIYARARNAERRRLLYVEDTVPIRRLGSGYVRANDVLSAIAASGWHVSVLPVNGIRHDIASLFADMPETAEILYDQTILTLPQLLIERAAFYDAIWISRTHNLDRVLPIFQEAGVDPVRTPIYLDTEAIVTARNAASAELRGEAFDFKAALEKEFAHVGICRHVSAVNQREADMLRGLGVGKVSVLGSIREPTPTAKSFSERAGLLIVAGIHAPDSPNLDSLRWYAHEIAPALAAIMPLPPVLTVVGYTVPEVDLSEFAEHPQIRLLGAVDDLTDHYNRHRVFIAPTRFSAGTPYKIYETAGFGLPAVVSDLLAEQLGWQDGTEVLAAPRNDASAFAARIALLYRSEALWCSLREAALRRLVAENAREPFEATVRAILTE